MEIEPQILGRRIRFFRTKIGMTQRELGALSCPKANNSAIYVSFIEQGRVRPGPKKLEKIAKVLGVTVESIVQEIVSLDPARINWVKCEQRIGTLTDRIERAKRAKTPPMEATYTDKKHDSLDLDANDQLLFLSRGKADMDIGHIKRGVYYPGKDLNIRAT